TGYSTLEYDLAEGARGSRQAHVEELLVAATGAEAAIAVNNNAAAVMLVLAALAAGKDVVVSRGELVEIGGSFRVPDILRASGARLVEVGTTNRTTAKDYAAAIGPETALLLKVHPSNFRIVGFTTAPTEEELSAVARAAKIPLVYDIGSGMLVDLPALGVPTAEPMPARALARCDVVTFSCDKLLGGPQAGVIAGKKSIVERAKKHPLARAMRIDKLSLAALAATLRLALDPARVREIPVVRMATEPAAEVRARAERLAAALRASGATLEVVATESQIGGGSTPGEAMASFAVAVSVAGATAARLEAGLRGGDPPVISRVQDDRVLLDVRTLAEAEIALCAASVAASIHRIRPAGNG
ncbi:MAG TPA: L-seryl-tRNA(Sec) selenium transferase, partial [bacterium]|nr:L-seryl-tRNA(Sec) selenium transferase [bacterium]